MTSAVSGCTFEKINSLTGLATSNLRKISQGKASPSFTTCYRPLIAICPKEFVYDLLDQLFSDKRVRTLAPAKTTGLRIEKSEDAWFVTKLSTAEKLSVDFVLTHLGANYNVVMDKFRDSGYVSIGKGIIHASNTHNELQDEGSVRNLGHFVLDSTYTAKDSDVMTYRAFRTTPEKAAKGKMILKMRKFNFLGALALGWATFRTSIRFYAPSDAENLQTEFSRSVVRSMVLPGTLPLFESDLAPQLKPKVEIVSASELERLEATLEIEE